MQPIIQHTWQLSEPEALALQQQLAEKVIQHNQFSHIKRVAGVDVAYQKDSDMLVAAVVVLDSTTLKVLETQTATDRAQFPYVPGLFSFRELPPLVQAFAQLQQPPDLVVCDGQGIAHPRRFGLACHLGVIFDIPSIGCGKTRLLGTHALLDDARGTMTALLDGNEVIGQVLRTQNEVNPVYVSIGHRIDLATACTWILHLSPHYRLPETTRQADQAVRRALR